MEKFQKINSELFALNAIEPEQMRKIIGGAADTGPGSMVCSAVPGSETSRSWKSDYTDADGVPCKRDISYSGADAGTNGYWPISSAVVGNWPISGSSFVTIQYGNPYGNPINTNPMNNAQAKYFPSLNSNQE